MFIYEKKKLHVCSARGREIPTRRRRAKAMLARHQLPVRRISRSHFSRAAYCHFQESPRPMQKIFARSRSIEWSTRTARIPPLHRSCLHGLIFRPQRAGRQFACRPGPKRGVKIDVIINGVVQSTSSVFTTGRASCASWIRARIGEASRIGGSPYR